MPKGRQQKSVTSRDSTNQFLGGRFAGKNVSGKGHMLAVVKQLCSPVVAHQEISEAGAPLPVLQAASLSCLLSTPECRAGYFFLSVLLRKSDRAGYRRLHNNIYSSGLLILH